MLLYVLCVVVAILAIVVGLCVRSLRQTNKIVSGMSQRFFESGVPFITDKLKTEVKVPEPWMDTDGISDENLPLVIGYQKSRHDEWIDEL